MSSGDSTLNPSRARSSSDAASGISGGVSRASSGTGGSRTMAHARPLAARAFAGHGTADIGTSGQPGYLDKAVSEKFTSLPLVDEEGNVPVLVEYIWVTRAGVAGASNPAQAMRSKTRVLDFEPKGIGEIPAWSSDGLSTNQGTAEERLSYLVEVQLTPACMVADPFRGHPHKLCLCEARLADGSPTPSNTRAELSRLASHPAAQEEDMWIGYEQEHAVFEADKKHPLGWPPYGVPESQVNFLNYCGIGGDAVGRELMESHVRACLFAGINIVGCNLEVLVGSMEYQLAPLPPVQAADEAWMARYIMARICEEYGVNLSFDPKPVANADGCAFHTNISTASTRDATGGKGWAAIERAMALLKATHKDHLAVYGPGLDRRLVGKEEYSSMDTFTWGVGDRSASVRIPFESARDAKGYFEDRRPGANADPYQIAARYLRTLVVGPADPSEDPGGKLAGVLAQLQRSPAKAAAAVEGAEGGDVVSGGGSGQAVTSHPAAETNKEALLRQTAEAGQGREKARVSEEQLGAATGGGSQQGQRQPGQPEQPSLAAAAATEQQLQQQQQQAPPASYSQQQQGQFPSAQEAQQQLQSPTIRQLLTRSRVALAKAMDTSPSQAAGQGGDASQAQASQPKQQMRSMSAGSLTLEETLDASRRRLQHATEGTEGQV